MAAHRSASKGDAPKGRTVTATLVVVKLKDGSTVYVANGVTLPEDASQESIDHLDSLGYLSDDK